MNLASELRHSLKDPPKTFRILQVAIAIICILIPLLLNIVDRDRFYPASVQLMSENEMQGYLAKDEVDSLRRIMAERFSSKLSVLSHRYQDSTLEVHGYAVIPRDKHGYRLSISDYAYSSKGYLFGMLYAFAAMLYLYNAVMYSKRKNELNIQRRGDWINFFIGLCLIGVILNPTSANKFLHNFFSILFFVGNIVEMSLPKQGETKTFKRLRLTLAVLTALSIGGSFLNFYTLLWGEWISLTIIAGFLILMITYRLQKQYAGNAEFEKTSTL